MTQPGLFEYEVEAEFRHEFRRNGAWSSYSPIVGGGANACVMHYIRNDARLRDGDLVLVDAGCEVDFLCPPNFPDYDDRRYNAIKVLSAKAKRTGASKLARLFGFFKEITSDIKSLVNFLENNSCQKKLQTFALDEIC